jgi:hypothetical protein
MSNKKNQKESAKNEMQAKTDATQLSQPELDNVVGGVTFTYGAMQVKYTQQTNTGTAQ